MSSTHGTETVAPSRSAVRTYVGVDVGEKHLMTAAPAGTATDSAYIVDGERLRDRFYLLTEMQRLLQRTSFTTKVTELEVFASIWMDIRERIIQTAVETVRYAKQFTAPVLVVEDLSGEPFALWEWRTEQTEFGTWLLPTLQETIKAHAVDAGIPVVEVDRAYSSQECHACDEIGELGKDTLTCTTSDCPVQEVCRDRSAALTIASRAEEAHDV